MHKFSYIAIILILLFGCKKSKNTSDSDKNQHIYDFMEIVIEDQNLNLDYGLTIEPEQNFGLVNSDNEIFQLILNDFQLDKDNVQLNKDDIQLDKGDVKFDNEKYNIQFNNLHFSFEDFSVFSRDFTKNDASEMIVQKESLNSFKWNNKLLGFNLRNKKNWYSFSIPLFSKDKNKAIIKIRNLCSGLCGSGKIIVFTKENNQWSSEIKNSWFH